MTASDLTLAGVIALVSAVVISAPLASPHRQMDEAVRRHAAVVEHDGKVRNDVDACLKGKTPYACLQEMHDEDVSEAWFAHSFRTGRNPRTQILLGEWNVADMMDFCKQSDTFYCVDALVSLGYPSRDVLEAARGNRTEVAEALPSPETANGY